MTALPHAGSPEKGDVQLKRVLRQPGTKGVVVAFWATWCEHCPEHLAALELLRQRYAARGIRFIALQVMGEQGRSDMEKSLSVARSILEEKKIKYPSLFDDITKDAVAKRYLGTGDIVLPTTFLVGPKGKLLQAYGPKAHGLERDLKKLLSAP